MITNNDLWILGNPNLGFINDEPLKPNRPARDLPAHNLLIRLEMVLHLGIARFRNKKATILSSRFACALLNSIRI